MSLRSTHGLAACIAILLSVSAPGRETLRLGGSGAGLGGLQILAKAFQLKHPDCEIVVLPSIGSSGGIRAVLDGKLDVGCTARPLRPEEQVPALAAFPWATTAFVVATQAGTPQESLTLAGIEAIYGGQRTQWQDGRPIRLILRPRSDSAHTYLAGWSAGMGAALERAHARPGVVTGITDQEALSHLERTPGAFGTTVLGLILSEGRQVQALPIDGLRPSDPAYPFLVTLSLVHRSQGLTPATQRFLQFVRAKAGQELLAKSGYRVIATSSTRERR